MVHKSRLPTYLSSFRLPSRAIFIRSRASNMGKRRASSQEPEALPTKRTRVDVLPTTSNIAPTAGNPNSVYERPGIIASANAAAQVDADPPLDKLSRAITALNKSNGAFEKGEAVVYWMRMEDMRISDNRALAAASAYAVKQGLPLIALFVLSPGDYKAHDRSPRRIDFTIRNLKILKESLAELHIPLCTLVHNIRATIPQKVVALASLWRATHVFANFEYEVDELRRDLSVLELGQRSGIKCMFSHDKCVVEPGRVTTKQEKPYTVYSPWLKTWSNVVQADEYCIQEAPKPKANNVDIHGHILYGSLFGSVIPDAIDGFGCEDAEKMNELWPAGEEAASQVLQRFLYTKSRASQLADSSPLAPGADSVPESGSRIGLYENDRNRADRDTTSRLSPYLSAGVISARQCLRGVLHLQKKSRVFAVKGNGPGVWMMEVAWRDFYTHIMATFPRVSMGRPYQEKFANVMWQEDPDGKYLNAWKEGKTGYPIVDAAMRQCHTQGWMHNRVRMVAAMFLTKHLMLDWRLGERYFMQNFVDGDVASNNGGWQWSASTGTDAQPYFRIFNPTLQSEKADPTGDYIRHFVPELRKLRGKAVHDPFHNMPKDSFKKLGYPEPIVDHKLARERAIRRFKNVGQE